MASTHPALHAGLFARDLAIRLLLIVGLVVAAWLLGSAVAEAATSAHANPGTTMVADFSAADTHTTLAELTEDMQPQLLANADSAPKPAFTHSSETGTALTTQANQPGTTTTTVGNVIAAVAPMQTTDNGTPSSRIWTGSVSVSVPTTSLSAAPGAVAETKDPTTKSASLPAIALRDSSDQGLLVRHSLEAMHQNPSTDQLPKPWLPESATPQNQLALLPVSGFSPTGATGHDGAPVGGLTGVLPPESGLVLGSEFFVQEHNALRISEGVPGLPSTSPD